MDLPFTLPDWLPAWGFLLLAIPALLFALAFLLMPFSVFGLKTRLEAVEAQLDAVAEELRSLNFRAHGLSGRSFTEDADSFDLPKFPGRRPAQPAFEQPRTAPPIPPPMTPVAVRDKPGTPRLPQRPARRTEPRLD